MEKIIHERLLCQGLEKLELPVGADPDEKHSPIFYTENLCTRKRIVVILGEPTQDLGWLAGRVANGPGGLVKGSVLSFLPILAEQAASPDDESPPGILIANMGQRYWWPEGKRALTISASADIPLPSMVHSGRKFVPELNEIPGSETALQHMTTVFQSVLAVVKATIDVIAIGESCEIAETFFDDQENWKQFGSRLNSMILLGTVYTTDKLQNEAFKKFLEQVRYKLTPFTSHYAFSSLTNPSVPVPTSSPQNLSALLSRVLSATHPYPSNLLDVHVSPPRSRTLLNSSPRAFSSMHSAIPRT